MTILDASMRLVGWFQTNESFELNRDFDKLILITETKKEDLAAFKCGLKNLLEANLIGKETVDNVDYYILNRPLESVEQNITVQYPVAIQIAKTLNAFCEKMKIKEDLCDFKDIKERDIKNMLYLLNDFLSQKEEKEEKEE